MDGIGYLLLWLIFFGLPACLIVKAIGRKPIINKGGK